MSTRCLLAVALTALALTALPAQACRLALALGFDVSRSVDAQDYRLQVDGIVAALFDPEVRDLILGAPEPVAMAVFEWAGPREQVLIADWILLEAARDIDTLARLILLHERRHHGLTAVGSALTYAQGLLRRAPPCLWNTLDLAGDGQTNTGPEPQRIYRERDFDGITVNGLAIGGHEATILDWFRRNVLHGPGAFVEFSATHEAFAETFRRKLIRELSDQMIGADTPPSTRAPS